LIPKFRVTPVVLIQGPKFSPFPVERQELHYRQGLIWYTL